MKNNSISTLDPDQIVKRKYDESNDAERVILVGGEKLELSIDSDKIANAVKDGLGALNVPINQSFGDLKVINTKENVFIPEIHTVEVPVITKEIEYREIEKPIIIEKIVTVEKPVVIKEIEVREVIKERYYPAIMKISAAIQAISVLSLLLLNIFRK